MDIYGFEGFCSSTLPPQAVWSYVWFLPKPLLWMSHLHAFNRSMQPEVGRETFCWAPEIEVLLYNIHAMSEFIPYSLLSTVYSQLINVRSASHWIIVEDCDDDNDDDSDDDGDEVNDDDDVMRLIMVRVMVIM